MCLAASDASRARWVAAGAGAGLNGRVVALAAQPLLCLCTTPARACAHSSCNNHAHFIAKSGFARLSCLNIAHGARHVEARTSHMQELGLMIPDERSQSSVLRTPRDLGLINPCADWLISAGLRRAMLFSTHWRTCRHAVYTRQSQTNEYNVRVGDARAITAWLSPSQHRWFSERTAQHAWRSEHPPTFRAHAWQGCGQRVQASSRSPSVLDEEGGCVRSRTGADVCLQARCGGNSVWTSWSTLTQRQLSHIQRIGWQPRIHATRAGVHRLLGKLARIHVELPQHVHCFAVRKPRQQVRSDHR